MTRIVTRGLKEEKDGIQGLHRLPGARRERPRSFAHSSAFGPDGVFENRGL